MISGKINNAEVIQINYLYWLFWRCLRLRMVLALITINTDMMLNATSIPITNILYGKSTVVYVITTIRQTKKRITKSWLTNIHCFETLFQSKSLSRLDDLLSSI